MFESKQTMPPENVAQTEMPKTSLTTITVRLPKDVDKAVEIAATNLEITKQQLVENALREYLERVA